MSYSRIDFFPIRLTNLQIWNRHKHSKRSTYISVGRMSCIWYKSMRWTGNERMKETGIKLRPLFLGLYCSYTLIFNKVLSLRWLLGTASFDWRVTIQWPPVNHNKDTKGDYPCCPNMVTSSPKNPWWWQPRPVNNLLFTVLTRLGQPCPVHFLY